MTNFAQTKRILLLAPLLLAAAACSDSGQRPSESEQPPSESEQPPSESEQRPYNGKYYGMLSGGDLHTNVFFRDGRITSARFRAEQTGDLSGVRFQARHDGPGGTRPEPGKPRASGHHSVGDGGELTLSLRKDIGGRPDLTSSGLLAITGVNNSRAEPPLTSRDEDDLWEFKSPTRVVVGTLYHIVFTNTHLTDYVSLNGHKPWVRLFNNNAGPYFADDFTVLQMNPRGEWSDYGILPWINYHYTDGSVTGVGENWLDKASVHMISGDTMARMEFTPTNYNYTVNALTFRTFASNSEGSLAIKLKRADGSELWSTTMKVAGNIPVGDREKIKIDWTRVEFPSSIEFKRESTYLIEFSGIGGAALNFNAVRDATKQGYRSRNRWLNASAQLSFTGGKEWEGWTVTGKNSNRSDFRMPVAFDSSSGGSNPDTSIATTTNTEPDAFTDPGTNTDSGTNTDPGTNTDGNAAPQVSAGADFSVTVNELFNFNGQASDDNTSLGNGLSVQWSVIKSSTGAIWPVKLFGRDNTKMQGKITRAGTFTLQLQASDGNKTSEDVIVVTALPAETINAMANSQLGQRLSWLNSNPVVSPELGLSQTENIEPDCTVKVCDGSAAMWSDNAIVALNRSSMSPYAQGVQRILFCTGYGINSFTEFADGLYGPSTVAAVEQFQYDEGLLVDGIVGTSTWNALQNKLTDSPEEDTTMTPEPIALGVLTMDPSCAGVDMFYQNVNGFTIESSPANDAINQSPFTVYQADLTN